MLKTDNLCKSLTISMYTSDKEFVPATYKTHSHVLCHDNKRSHFKHSTNDGNGYTVIKQSEQVFLINEHVRRD